jgi:DUF971 family protein
MDSDGRISSPKNLSVWPTDISYNRELRVLNITFETGEVFDLPAEYLRVESPSAEIQGHNGDKIIIGGRRHVGIMNIEQVGNYAVRITFDDLHDTGLYSWQILYDLGTHKKNRWANYLDALDAKGLTRNP